MAYETGVAQNERDLLDKLNTFLTSNENLVEKGQNWTVLFDRTIPANNLQAECRQIAWKSTGTGVEQDIYVGAQTMNTIARDIYNISFFGGTFFNQNLVKTDNLKAGFVNCSPAVTLFCDARDFQYHFIANGRHFKIATQITKVTSTAYCGFILPIVPPTEYPYPLVIAGSAPEFYNDDLIRYSTYNKYNSSIADARHENCWLMTPEQAWRDFYSIISDGSYSKEQSAQALYPLRNIDDNNYLEYVMSRLDGLGCYPLIPVEFISKKGSSQGVNRWGAFDGVYWTPGIQRSHGDLVNIKNGTQGIVLNSGFRTETTSYFVFEKEE
ncbi:hypothetical protein QJU96_10015 [Pasteurella skyensis]|uniref:Virion structural protein n=1 Tax=Phocoenobacter skyensis TaxID=97481 RepID=A0AAJ6NEQ2_9PAST|nr:hypothetical protein [Pasteurella skyensis]MDP8171617.1 hypothetical protein [Pasteurella skyensis]MDP8175453.1 hypothetical protein [Pasteurella skyensis]